jgi:hypothetical protein
MQTQTHTHVLEIFDTHTHKKSSTHTHTPGMTVCMCSRRPIGKRSRVVLDPPPPPVSDPVLIGGIDRVVAGVNKPDPIHTCCKIG